MLNTFFLQPVQKINTYLLRTFKATLLIWSLRPSSSIRTTSKRTIFTVLVFFTTFISGTSWSFSIGTATKPKKNNKRAFNYDVRCFLT